MNRLLISILTPAMVMLACTGCLSAIKEPWPATSAHLPVQALTVEHRTNLTLVEQEYTVAELRQMDISCVKVFGGSDDIVFTRGGDTLKLRYYQQSANDYQLTTEVLHNGTRTYLCLTGNKSGTGSGIPRTIEVSLPENFAFYRLYGGTESGSISFDGCASSLYYANSIDGDISFRDCTADEKLTVESHSGCIDITGLTTGAAFDGYILSESGAVQFGPIDPVDNYHYIFGTRTTNSITVNGKSYSGGAFELNPSATKTIRLESGYFFDDDIATGRTGQGTASFTIGR